MNLTIEQKWDLLLGKDNSSIPEPWQGMNKAINALYGNSSGKGTLEGYTSKNVSQGKSTGRGTKSSSKEGTGKSTESSSKDRKGSKNKGIPSVSYWIGDIRTYFQNDVVQVMQKDAMKKFGIDKFLLTGPEMIDEIKPDVNLVSTILLLSESLSDEMKESARIVVQRIVEELMKKLQEHTQNTIRGAINRSITTLRPRHNEIDWHKTIRANLKHYQKDYQTIIPEKRYGFGHKRPSLKQVILCIDRSGSMGNSVVYSSIFGAVMASIPSIKTHMIIFDIEVVDLTDELEDPVEMLFGIQLGVGTDINRALAYCQSKINKPEETILILISDMYEGGNEEEMLKRCKELVENKVKFITLLALDDSGAPSYDRYNAEFLTELGVPCFACTPNLFPELIANAITGGIEKVDTWVKNSIIQPNN